MKCALKSAVLVLCFLVVSCSSIGNRHGSGGVNASRHLDKPYIVLVSLDGFRWDYPELFNPPTIARMIETGFRAERLVPVFPTLTFPNHYSIATGLFPEHHGIVANYFRAPELESWYELNNRATVEDGRFYGGEPIWINAERQGMVTAAFFFVGTEAPIQGIRPTHWRTFSKEISGEQRVDQVLAWLSEPPETRPHLATLYFEDVDDHSHWYGVGSGSATDAVKRVDSLLERLMSGLFEMPYGEQVNIIVVSDHGQSSYLQAAEPLVLDEYIDLTGIRVVGKGSYSFLYYEDQELDRVSKDQDLLKAAWAHGRVLTPEEAPDQWHVGENDRWPDLMVQPDPGYMVVSHEVQLERLNPGAHGWPPEFVDMHGVLFGTGPAFRPGAQTGPVNAIDVLPLILDILSLEGPNKLDGNPEALRSVLTTP